MGKAVIFVRVSTEKQHLESQEAELRRMALYDGFNESDIIVKPSIKI
jgi:DNA invertase Pin-like site-specific DNA recombinase